MLKSVEIINFEELKELLTNDTYWRMCLYHKTYLPNGIRNDYVVVDMFAAEADVTSCTQNVFFSDDAVHVCSDDADNYDERIFRKDNSMFLKFTIAETGRKGLTMINFEAESKNPFREYDTIHLSLDI